MSSILALFVTIVATCANWFNSLLTAVDGHGLIISIFIIYLIVNFVLKPLRGGGAVRFGRDFTRVNSGTRKE